MQDSYHLSVPWARPVFSTDSTLIMQEARTLKHNNVHNGVWHGRGDILVIGSQVVFSPNGLADPALNRPRRYPSWRKTCKVELPTEPVFLDTGVDHAWTGEVPQIQHLPLISRWSSTSWLCTWIISREERDAVERCVERAMDGLRSVSASFP